jgi:hypothetical protein
MEMKLQWKREEIAERKTALKMPIGTWAKLERVKIDSLTVM